MIQLGKNTLPGILLFLINVSALAQGDLRVTDQTAAALKKFRGEYVKTLLENTPERMALYYNDSIRLMPEFQQTVLGKAPVLLYHQAFIKRFRISELTRQPVEILDFGARVMEFGAFSMTLEVKASGTKFTLQGKYQDFWKRSDTGLLSLITQAWNYNHPVNMADQLRFEDVPVVNVALAAHLPINSNISFELAALNLLQETIITQHDAKLWSRFFSDDPKYIYSGNPVYSGQQAVRHFLDEHVKGLPVFEKLAIRNDRIDHLGTYVIEYASHIASVRNGDFSGVFTGKNINIWRREKDGSLKIFREMAMYD